MHAAHAPALLLLLAATGCGDKGDSGLDCESPTTWYQDADGDGFGNTLAVRTECAQPDGYVDNATDCDDTSAQAYPGGIETCDSLDNDCDGVVDEGDATDAITFYADADSDGYGNAAVSTQACEAPLSYVADATDCFDADPAIHPGAVEVCDEIDNDCNGDADGADAVGANTWYPDDDEDRFGEEARAVTACEAPRDHISVGGDCDDNDPDINPTATEVCDGADNDCDGTADGPTAVGATTWYQDADGDGWGDASLTLVECGAPSGYAAAAGDCDESRPTVNPAATEACDALDNDCDGGIDEAGAYGSATFYYDADGDGFGTPSITITACTARPGFVVDDTDCDDTNADVHPAAAEVPDGIDNNCDGTADDVEWSCLDGVDDDADGLLDCADDDCASSGACHEVACLDGVDDDADGLLDCEDDDCDASRDCHELDCTDGLDDDADGAADCDDDECWGTSCHPEGVLARVTGGAFAIDWTRATSRTRSAVPPLVQTAQETSYIASFHSVWGVVRTLPSPTARWSTATTWNTCTWTLASAMASQRAHHTWDSGSSWLVGNLGKDRTLLRSGFHVNDGCSLLPDDSWFLPSALELGAGTPQAGAWLADSLSSYGGELLGFRTRQVPSWYVGTTASHASGTSFPTSATVRSGHLSGWLNATGREIPAGLAASSVDGEPYLDAAEAIFEGSAGQYAGWRVDGAGDVNGDGTPDLAIGTRCDGAYVVWGPAAGTIDLDVAEVRIGEADPAGCLGYDLDAGRDLDLDGVADLLLTDPFADTAASNAGAAYLVSGPLTGTYSLPTADAEILGASAGDALSAVAALEDPLGDGDAGIVVGSSSGLSGMGLVYVFYGAPTGTVSASAADGVMEGGLSDGAGSRVADAGDTNGDGFSEVLVLAGSGGAVFVVPGPASGFLDLPSATWELTTSGSAVSDVRSAGDVDGDGLADLLVGSAGTGSGGTVWLVHGPVPGGGPLSSLAGATLEGMTGSNLGTSVAALDYNGDAWLDLALGAPGAEPTSDYAGAVWMVAGPVSGTQTLTARSTWVAGAWPKSEAGTSVASAGDVDLDGRDDLLVGDTAALHSWPTPYGAAYLVLGTGF